MKHVAVLVYSLLMLAESAPTWAAQHYVRAGAAGSDNGLDWNNAWTALPTTLARGDTYYVADGTYAPYKFDDAESGGLYIYINKAVSGGDHGTDIGWNNSYGDGQAVFQPTQRNQGVITFTKSYYDVDGQVGAGTGADRPHGFKFYIPPGTPYPNDMIVMILDETYTGQAKEHIHLRHCEMHHWGTEPFIEMGTFTVVATGDSIRVPDASIFNANGTSRVRLHSTGTLPSGLSEGSGYTGPFYAVKNRNTANHTVQLAPYGTTSIITGMNAGTGTHTLYGAYAGFGFAVHSQAALRYSLFQHCYIHDVSHKPIHLSGANHNIFEYCSVARNHSDAISHAEGIYCGGNCDSNIVRWCAWEDIEGTSIISAAANNAWEVYGNLFYYTRNYPNPGQGGGYVGMAALNANADNKFYNNTVYGQTGGAYSIIYFSGNGNAVYNNIWAHCGRSRWGGAVFDYNLYYDLGDDGGYLAGLAASEPNSRVLTADPFVSSTTYNFHLSQPTLPGISLAYPYDNDMAGNARGADGVWDRGAYEYTTTGMRNANSGMRNGPAARPFWPNPVTIKMLRQIPGVRMHDVHGLPIAVDQLVNNGIYFIETAGGLERVVIMQ